MKFKVSTKDPAEMTAGAINQELDRLDVENCRICQEMIEAGRGHERPSETLKKTDPLSCRFIGNHWRHSALKLEIEIRYGPNPPSRLPAGRSFGPRVRKEKVA